MQNYNMMSRKNLHKLTHYSTILPLY